MIREYRGARAGRYVDFGVHGTVLVPGPVAVGDAVALVPMREPS
jgi:hypothetical protein